MNANLSPAAEKLMKQLFKTSQTAGKDFYIPDICQKGTALFNQKKYSESLGYYELYAHFNPLKPESWNNLGNNYLMLNNLPKAFECYQKVIALDEKDFNCLVNIGNCHNTWNQPDQAAVYYLKAAIVNMKSTVPLKGLAEIYKRKQHYDSAMIFLNQSFYLDQKDIQIMMDLAMINLMQNKIGKGLEYLKRILSIDPKHQMAQMIMFKLKEEGKI